MKTLINNIYALVALIMVTSCGLDDIPNPNAPTIGSFENGATKADLDVLVVGLEAVSRNDLHFHYQTTSILARDYYDLTGIDPRFTQEILKGPLDNNGFLTTRSYSAWYKIVQSANLLELAIDNSITDLSDEEINGYYAFAKTMKAYALLMVANRQYTNGIRIEVSDKDNLGAFQSYTDALSDIRSLLNEANDHLTDAGATFSFPLSDGFGGATGTIIPVVGDDDIVETFDIPSGFAKFNRAIAARAAIYQGNKADVLTLLGQSFMDLTAPLDREVAHVFGQGGNELTNSQYYIPNQSANQFMAHDSWYDDAEVGDNRLSKVGLFMEENADGDVVPTRQSFDGLSADYQVRLYSSLTDPVTMIRNEELILLYAEANIGTDNAEAIAALDVIRTAAGLLPYSGATTDAALEDELLVQRRYSLFGEGHRWVDLRRFNRMDEIPLDRAGDNVIDAFPTPVNENEVLGG
ncbi:MAG: RagB/SusD family nutrient uptake outer membrane protein [Reichenbachiella sp.]|uniref:RagB/SusD family nutrient uptake outer membrane protein n=1 Tax=Reichenbachiella sp. TaxID=2184521 RepID=UPI0032969AB7